ncbi:DUF397 domain-containing protein [Streptomyces sp. NPDC049881]|uniref:DUF397 domain-containing protein n=1 Tax=Streptomyces sp. NPDC049881 TaxID=3155778 RepID=UPI0034371820
MAARQIEDFHEQPAEGALPVNAQTNARPPVAEWVKSSYSDGDGGHCIECSLVHLRDVGVMPLRDSKVPHGPVVAVRGDAWGAFLGALASGELL